MLAIFKRIIFMDEWIRPEPWPWPACWFCRPRDPVSYEFVTYALGYRWEATDREWAIIRKHKMLQQPAVTLSANDPPVTFAEILGPELVPEVHPDQMQLMSVEMRLRSSALSWTRFFENVIDP